MLGSSETEGEGRQGRREEKMKKEEEKKRKKIEEEERKKIEKEIKRIQKSANPDEEIRRLGEGIAQESREVVPVAKEVVENEEMGRKGEKVFAKETERELVARRVIRLLEAVRKGIVVAQKPEADGFLRSLSRVILSPSLSECNQLAAYLTSYLLGDKDIIINPPDQPKSDFQRDFEALSKINPRLAAQVKKALIEAVEKEGIGNITKEMVEKYLMISESVEDRINRRIPFELLDFYSQSDPEILRLLIAIQTKEAFLEYLGETREKINSGEIEIKGRTDQEKLSKYLEEQFVDLIDQLYYKFDINPSYITEEFGHVESMGFTRSVQMAVVYLTNQVEKLIKDVSEDPYFKGRLDFFTRYTLTEERIERGPGEAREKMAYYLRVQPHGRRVDLADFLRFALNEMGHAREIREFTHNSRLLFRQGAAGKEGFWGQMVGYASRMKATDFDSISYLPHYEVYQSALIIYNQFLQAELAKRDWILDPKMFARKESGLTEIEEQVLQILKEKYNGKKTDLQIRSALSRAIGVSLGILLTEVETIADADPNLKVGPNRVDATFVGEWLSDTVATNVFNPFQRGVLRWSAEGVTGGPMAFLEIPDPRKIKRFLYGIWDHRDAFNAIKRFYKTFLEGKKGTAKKGHIRLLDIRNPGRIGSIITRGGWREYYSYDYQLTLAEGKNYLDFYRVWRRIENIGFEPLVDLVTNRMGDFISGKVEEEDRMRLIIYLAKTYFLDIFTHEELIQITTEKDFWERWNERYKNKGKKISELRSEFLFQALARVLLYRLPSKLITQERTRWSEDGERMWEILRKNVFGEDKESYQRMDQALRDLILVQGALRTNLSEELGEIQENNGDIGQIEDTYLLTEEKIEELLKKSGIDDERRIEDVKKLFMKLREIYLGENGKINSLADKLKKYRKNFPFALASEEIDYRFFVLRGAGETTIKRALNDIATVEQNVAGAYQQLIGLWQRTAVSGKRDFSEIVSLLAKVKTTLTSFHGKDYANEIVFYLAYLTIQYFKRDTMAKPLGGLAGIGRINSIAAEMAGGSMRVWEWDSRDIGKFVYALEIAGVLEKNPYDLSKIPSYEAIHFSILGKNIKLPEEINLSKWLGERLGRSDNQTGEIIPVKIFGKEIKINLPKRRKEDFSIYSKTLKDLAGGAFIHKVYDAFNTVIPIGLAIILLFLISKALKEAFQGKR